jgi:pimeloyl-ACP methyl ester carboxylesterase
MKIAARDGVMLAYDEAGSADPPVILLHAWGGGRALMAPQLEHLRRRHRVVSLDLRGFGESEGPAQRYTPAGFADDVAWVAEKLGLARPIVIGHSLGGTVALELAARFPELPRAVVILEALVVAPPALVDGFRPVLDGIRSPACAAVLAQFSDQLTGPRFDARDRERIRDEMIACSPPVMISSLEELLGYDSATAAAACRAPVLYVSSGPWYTDVERFRSLCPQLVTAQALGCGHYFQLEVPELTNAIIDRFVQIT